MDNGSKFLPSKRTVGIIVAILATVMALNMVEDGQLAFGKQPGGGADITPQQVREKIVEMVTTPDTSIDEVDLPFVDYFLALRDSTRDALEYAAPISEWGALVAIDGIGDKKAVILWILGFDLD